MLKRVSIVFQESTEGDVKSGQGFVCFLEGLDSERLKTTPQEKWTAAEFWATKCFQIIQNLLKKTGAAVSEQEKGRA